MVIPSARARGARYGLSSARRQLLPEAIGAMARHEGDRSAGARIVATGFVRTAHATAYLPTGPA
jgi:hypothetical protein